MSLIDIVFLFKMPWPSYHYIVLSSFFHIFRSILKHSFYWLGLYYTYVVIKVPHFDDHDGFDYRIQEVLYNA